MVKLWIFFFSFISVIAKQNFYPRRITYCQEGWYPDPIVPSVVNGDYAWVTYTFYFALEDFDQPTVTVKIDFPSDFPQNQVTLTATKIEGTNNCYSASELISQNLVPLTATGPFSLQTNFYGSQPTHLGWNFATVGFGPTVGTMFALVARFKTDLDQNGTAEDQSTKQNQIYQTSTIEVIMVLTKPMYQGDLFLITFSERFDLSAVTKVKSVFLGKGTILEGQE